MKRFSKVLLSAVMTASILYPQGVFAATSGNVSQLKAKLDAQKYGLVSEKAEITGANDNLTGGIFVETDSKRNNPRFLSGQLSDKPVENNAEVEEFFEANKDAFNVTNGDFKIVSTAEDDNGIKHYKTEQNVDGIKVFGSELVINVNKDGDVYSINGQAEPNIPVQDYKDKVKITSENAIKLSEKSIEINEKDIQYDKAPSTELNLYNVNEVWKPVYLVKISFSNPYPAYWHIYVDAESGEVISKANEVRFDGPATGTGVGVLGDSKPLNIYLSGGKYSLRDTTKPMNGGEIRTYTSNNGTSIPGSAVTSSTTSFNSGAQQKEGAAVDAQYNATKVYDYYKENFNRNSFDNKGSSIISSVNFDRSYNNAYWNGSQMVYGDGDGRTFIPLSCALDVVGHEITHAVTETTANLAYHNQSGALNESFSDVMGYFAQGRFGEWNLGVDCYTPGIAGDGLRNLQQPSKVNQPDDMKGYKNLPDTKRGDWGGVHINSGIANHAFYYTVTKMSNDDCQKIYYNTLTKYLTSQSQFMDCRNALMQSAADLFGMNSDQYIAVQNAWAKVGIGTAYSQNALKAAVLSVDKSTNTGDYTLTMKVPANNLAVSYELYENNVSKATDKLTPNTDKEVVLTKQFTGVEKGTYTYKVTEKDASGKLIDSNTISVTVTADANPTSSLKAAVLSVDKSTNTGDYALTIKVPADNLAVSYELYENNVSKATDKLTPNTDKEVVLTKQFTGVEKGTYTYKVTEKDASGNQLDSNTISVTVSANSSSQEWVANNDYKVGDIVTYQGATYSCVIAHHSQADWTPNVVPALWSKQ